MDNNLLSSVLPANDPVDDAAMDTKERIENALVRLEKKVQAIADELDRQGRGVQKAEDHKKVLDFIDAAISGIGQFMAEWRDRRKKS